MFDAEIVRLTQNITTPSRGIMIIDGEPTFTTLELPWINNQHNISCIPLGVYECKKVFNRHTLGGLDIPVTFEITNVPNRSGILIHVGNTVRDTNGCPLIGIGFDTVLGELGITQSRQAFSKFIALTRGVDSFGLKISRI